MIKIIIKFVLISILLFKFAYAEKITIFEFTDIELESLEVRKVRGADNKTAYSLGSNENGNYLKAIADNAASGLGKQVSIDLNLTPTL